MNHVKSWGKNIKEGAIARVNTPSRSEFVRLEIARKPPRLEQNEHIILS